VIPNHLANTGILEDRVPQSILLCSSIFNFPQEFLSVVHTVCLPIVLFQFFRAYLLVDIFSLASRLHDQPKSLKSLHSNFRSGPDTPDSSREFQTFVPLEAACKSRLVARCPTRLPLEAGSFRPERIKVARLPHAIPKEPLPPSTRSSRINSS